MVHNYRPPSFLVPHLHSPHVQESPFANRPHPNAPPFTLPGPGVFDQTPTVVTAPPLMDVPPPTPPPVANLAPPLNAPTAAPATAPSIPSSSPPPAAEDHQARAMEKLATALEALRLESHALTEAARADALEVGFQVARKILEQAVTTDVSAMLSLVKSALRRMADARHLKVRMNPQDLPALQVAIHEGGHHELTLARLELVEDTTLARGDVMVEGDLGAVDGRIETRLEEVRMALAGTLQGD